MYSKMFTLRNGDIARGAITAIFTGVMIVLASVVLSAGFDAFSTDWVAVGKSAVNAGLASFVGYLMKNFITDDNGRMFGAI